MPWTREANDDWPGRGSRLLRMGERHFEDALPDC